MFFLCSSCGFPPISQKYSNWWTGSAKFPIGVNECVNVWRVWQEETQKEEGRMVTEYIIHIEQVVWSKQIQTGHFFFK